MNGLSIYFMLTIFLIDDQFTSAQTKLPLESDFVAENHSNYQNLDHENCGISLAKRIVGGHEAQVGMFPWMTVIGYDLLFGRFSFFCGGSILNRHYVLTAAHCFDVEEYRKKYNLILVAGIKSKLELYKEPGQLRKSRRVIIHPDYRRGNMDDEGDIALVEVLQPFQINFAVRPICLPTKSENLERKTAIVAGWGTTQYGGDGVASLTLKYLTKIIFESDDCNALTRNNKDGHLLCALAPPRTAPCGGDSGGPLMVRDNRGVRQRFVVQGVLSHGPSYCGIPLPDFYARVSYYLKFILDNIKKA